MQASIEATVLRYYRSQKLINKGRKRPILYISEKKRNAHVEGWQRLDGRMGRRVRVGAGAFMLRGSFVDEMRRGARARMLLLFLIEGWGSFAFLMMSREVDRIVLWDPELFVTLGQFLTVKIH